MNEFGLAKITTYDEKYENTALEIIADHTLDYKRIRGNFTMIDEVILL